MRVYLFILMAFLASGVAHADPCESGYRALAENKPSLPSLKHALDALSSTEAPEFRRAAMNAIGIDDPELHFATRLRKSMKGPVPLFSNGDPTVGGSSIFRGNVFVEGFFRTVGLREKIHPEVSTLQVEREQPWLRWDAGKGDYVLEHGGTQRALLEPYMKNGKVTLYRGLGKDQADLLRVLKAGHPEALEKLFTQHRDALFFTPDEASAQLWSQGYYVEITLTEADLDSLYAGIESGYVEAAVADPSLMLRVIRSLKVHPFTKRP